MNLLISEDNFNVLYNIVYACWFFSVLFTVLQFDVKGKNRKYRKVTNFLSVIFITSLIIIVGLRDYNVGTDTYNYHLFNWVNDFKSESKTEFLFDNLIKLLKWLKSSFSLFLVIVACIFYLFIYKSLKNFSNYFNVNLLILLFIFVSMFFAKTLSINVIRQGLALAFLLFSLSLWITQRKRKSQILFVLLALITHTTTVIPIFIFLSSILILKNVKLKYLLFLYFGAIGVAALGYGILNLAPFLKDVLAGDRYSTYLSSESDGKYSVGFKPQFVMFNTLFLMVFYLIYRNNNNTSYFTVNYSILLKYYIVASVIFFLLFQIPYSDRFGLFSWIIIPILIAPLFSYKNKIVLYKTPLILFFSFIYLFFTLYDSSNK